MHTAQSKLPSFKKRASLSPARPLLSSTKAVLDTQRPISDDPAWLKSPIIAGASREAGSALYEILGIAELMRVAYEKGEIESLRNRLAILTSEAVELSSALDDIIELAKLETGTVAAAYEHFDVIALLQEVAQTARLIIGQKPVTVMDVASPSPVTILSDPAKMKQLMMGLVSNAAKFTNRGRIALILNEDKDRIRLTVTDTGKGMTAEQIDRIFTDSESGYGDEIYGSAAPRLGLKITRNLVKLLEGSISISSKVGEGTIVEVSLPHMPAGKAAGSCNGTHAHPAAVRGLSIGKKPSVAAET